MPVSFETMTAKKVTLKVPWDAKHPDDDLVRVVYKPAAVTTEAVAESHADEDGSDKHEAIIEQLVSFLDSWDIKWSDEDADPIAITRDNLRKLPITFLVGVMNAINADQFPDPKARK